MYHLVYTLVYPTIYTLGTPCYTAHHAHARRYPVVHPVPDNEALGSTLGLIRELWAQGKPLSLKSVTEGGRDVAQSAPLFPVRKTERLDRRRDS